MKTTVALATDVRLNIAENAADATVVPKLERSFRIMTYPSPSPDGFETNLIDPF